METFLKVCNAVGAALHWLTGWIVHPGKGGCCEMEKLEKNDKQVYIMAKYDLFSIYDMKARAYANPFYAVNSDIAVRLFMDIIRSEGELSWAKYPGDFCLYHIGTFDTNSAFCENSSPTLIALGSSCDSGRFETSVSPDCFSTSQEVEPGTTHASCPTSTTTTPSTISAGPTAQPCAERGFGGNHANGAPGWKARLSSIFGISRSRGE